jgi:hypothetical protein
MSGPSAPDEPSHSGLALMSRRPLRKEVHSWKANQFPQGNKEQFKRRTFGREDSGRYDTTSRD